MDGPGSDWLIVEREIADGATVPEVLGELAASYPKFKSVIFNPEVGQPGDQVLVTVNNSLLQRDELSRVILKSGDVLILFPIYSGG